MADKRLSTPEGIAVYPRLKTPDTKFDDLGQYKADVSVPLADAEPLMAELAADFKKHTGKAPKKSENTMWIFETDDQGEETGNVIFKIRVKNKMNRKGELWDRRPKLFDAALKPIDVNPWGGSKMVVSFDVYCWDAGGKTGISLQPVGVQIIDLKTGSGPDASSMGFQKKDGYVADDEAADAGLKNDDNEGESENPGEGMGGDDTYDAGADY